MKRNVWTAEEARQSFSELLDAATNHGPQRIQAGNLVFEIALVRASETPRGKEILKKGGPLPDHYRRGEDGPD